MPANAILERHEYDAASSACVSNAWNVALLDERDRHLSIGFAVEPHDCAGPAVPDV